MRSPTATITLIHRSLEALKIFRGFDFSKGLFAETVRGFDFIRGLFDSAEMVRGFAYE